MSHAGSVLGSITGGPVHGHVRIVGGWAGMSQPSVQAPVAALGLDATGLKQGAHFSPAAHVLCGKREASPAIAGRHVERQRPSDPATEVHVGGTPLPAVEVMESGAQNPPGQVASWD